MKKIAIAMLTTTMIGIPAFAFAASNNNQMQQPQGGQMQQSQGSQMQQPQNNDQKQAQQNKPNQRQNAQNQQNQQNAKNQQSQQNQQSAENNQPIQPNDLSRGEIRQVQQALDKDGFKAGTADGRWGPHTKNAVKQFQQSKQIQANGKLDEQTVADLGLDFSQQQQQQQK